MFKILYKVNAIFRQGVIHTNRGNNLVKKLIETRYPNLSKEELGLLDKYMTVLSQRRAALELGEISETDRKVLKLVSEYLILCVMIGDNEASRVGTP